MSYHSSHCKLIDIFIAKYYLFLEKKVTNNFLFEKRYNKFRNMSTFLYVNSTSL